MRRIREEGFTLIELLVAMSIFALMLLVVSSVFVGIMRNYRAGSAIRETQQNTRTLMNEVMSVARQASEVKSGAGPERICFNTVQGWRMYEISGGALLRGPAWADCRVAFAGPSVILSDERVVMSNLTESHSSATLTSLGTVTISLSAESAYCTTGSEYCRPTTLTNTAIRRGSGI